MEIPLKIDVKMKLAEKADNSSKNRFAACSTLELCVDEQRAGFIQSPTHAYRTYMSTAVHPVHTQTRTYHSWLSQRQVVGELRLVAVVYRCGLSCTSTVYVYSVRCSGYKSTAFEFQLVAPLNVLVRRSSFV